MQPSTEITLPRGCRNRMYYVIVMPLNSFGYGPADDGDINMITWEVWDQVLVTHGSFEFLPDAIDFCEKMNEEYYKNGK